MGKLSASILALLLSSLISSCNDSSFSGEGGKKSNAAKKQSSKTPEKNDLDDANDFDADSTRGDEDEEQDEDEFNSGDEGVFEEDDPSPNEDPNDLPEIANPLNDIGAAGPDKEICNQNIAVSLVLDLSGSMSGTNLTLAKSAAVNFLNSLAPDDQAGVVTFSRTATTLQALGASASASSSIETLTDASLGAGTNITSGLEGGQVMLDGVSDDAMKKFLIILSDGRDIDASAILDSIFGGGANGDAARTPPGQAANNIKQNGTRIISIGFEASGRGQELMRGIATSQEDYIESPAAGDLAQAFTQIKESLCRATP